MRTRVLLVEDEHLVRLVAAETLREHGYHVVEASTGDEAAAILQDAAGFDLLFTDVTMPGSLDGIMVAERARERQPYIPVLVVSAYASEITARLDSLEPPPAFLSKPYRARELLEVLQNLTGSSKRSQ